MHKIPQEVVATVYLAAAAYERELANKMTVTQRKGDSACFKQCQAEHEDFFSAIVKCCEDNWSFTPREITQLIRALDHEAESRDASDKSRERFILAKTALSKLISGK